jgi:hypothetical protein
MFGAQAENISYARIPNATGPFLKTGDMTPGGSNVFITGIEETKSKISVRPNPTKGTLYVESEVVMTNVSVFDIYGRLLNTTELNASAAEMSLQNLQPGMYILRVRSGKFISTEKIIKE